MKLSAGNLVSFISSLNKDYLYNYINPRTKGVIKIEHIDSPEGPIFIKRWNPNIGETDGKKVESISREMIWRVANAISAEHPFNIDKILGASYNTRSVFETLLALTPQFYYCYPGRVETIGSTSSIQNGHKYLLWRPSAPHAIGKLELAETNLVISEITTSEVVYDGSFTIPAENNELDINVQRRHAQIQIALYYIGLGLGYRTWIAQNDKGLIYNDKKLFEYDGIVQSLNDEVLLKSHSDAVKAALLIDCIWFKNGRLMPAVMEVEHTTGVTSGLTRMLNFKQIFPPFPTRYVIVAPDDDRNKVVQEANKQQFQELDTRFMPYSAVEEFWALCNRRKIGHAVTESFLDCYMEKVVC